MTSRSGLSACIITYNEADRIEACLQSVSFCDEIIVVDSHSTDTTRELAARLGARVIERDWPGYRSQKQFAVETASNDWVLCLDADERVSEKLRREIEGLRTEGFPQFAGWWVPRITDYFGRFLRHGNAYPDRLIRLFDRRRGGWIGYEIHELAITAGKEVAFAHSLNRVTGTRKDGKRIVMWLRATICLRRIEGLWMFTHEHYSVPIEMTTGRAAFDAAP